MSAVTGLRRLPILAIAALLAAGCGASPLSPSSLPGSSPHAMASPSQTPPATVTPAATEPAETEPAPSPSAAAEPSEPGCPSAPHGDNPMVSLIDDRNLLWKPFDITRLNPVAAPEIELTPPDPFAASWTDFLLGGGETRMELNYQSGGWPDTPHTITRFRLTLETEREEPFKLPVRFETGKDGSTDVIVDVPNITMRGRYDVKVEWHDTCFAYEGRLSSPLIIDRRGSIDGCSEDRDTAFEELGATFEPPIGVGPLDANLAPWQFNGKVTSLAVIDPLPPYVGFNRDSPTFAAGPGTIVEVSNWSEAIALWPYGRAEVEFYRRGELIRWIEGGWIHGDEPEAKVVFRSTLIEGTDAFTFRLPDEPGRYAATAAFSYNAACSFGAAGFVVGIDVEAP